MYLIIAGVSTAIICGFIYRRFMSLKRWRRHDPKNEQNVDGKIVVITGANSGLGKQVAYEMYKRGAIVIMACRDMESANLAAEEIKGKVKETPVSSQLIPIKLDLASFDSVRQFVKEFHKQFDHVNILINNAGVYIPFKKSFKTRDGYEIHFQVNHLSHFLLTSLLMKEIKNGVPSRVVSVTSSLYLKACLKLDDVNLDKIERTSKNKMLPYMNSKYANVLFSYELSKQCQQSADEADVHTYAVCPGWVFTNLSRYSDLKWYQYILFAPIAFLFMRTVEEGSQSILHCVLSSDCSSETGKLYRNCQVWDEEVNDEVAKKLWKLSEAFVGITKFGEEM